MLQIVCFFSQLPVGLYAIDNRMIDWKMEEGLELALNY